MLLASFKSCQSRFKSCQSRGAAPFYLPNSLRLALLSSGGSSFGMVPISAGRTSPRACDHSIRGPFCRLLIYLRLPREVLRWSYSLGWENDFPFMAQCDASRSCLVIYSMLCVFSNIIRSVDSLVLPKQQGSLNWWEEDIFYMKSRHLSIRAGSQAGDVTKSGHKIWEKTRLHQTGAKHGTTSAMPIGAVNIYRPALLPLLGCPLRAFVQLFNREACAHIVRTEGRLTDRGNNSCFDRLHKCSILQFLICVCTWLMSRDNDLNLDDITYLHGEGWEGSGRS